MKEILEEIESRVKSPLFGYFIFSAAALNWESLFYLLIDQGSAIDRIAYFHEHTNFLSLFIYPSLTAITYSVLYPWIQFVFMFLSSKPTELRNNIQAHSEHKLLLKKQELEETRRTILANAENELIERAKRDIELRKIEDQEVRKNLEIDIEKLRKEQDQYFKEISKENEIDLAKDQEEILRIITLNGGEITEKQLIKASKHDKVKTEYFLEDLEEKGYLRKNYDPSLAKQDYVYSLTTKSKKIMVEKEVAK